VGIKVGYLTKKGLREGSMHAIKNL
jgi:hypothetical protein